MGQPGERVDVEPDLLAQTVDVELVEVAARAEAGVVDDEVDGLRSIGDPRRDPLLAGPRAEIGRQHLDPGELGGQRLEPIDTPRDDDDRHARGRQLPGQLLTDPARSSGDECGRERVGRHRPILTCARHGRFEACRCVVAPRPTTVGGDSLQMTSEPPSPA